MIQAKQSNLGAEPVTLADVKLYCKIDYSDDDALITGLIKSAREKIESFTGLSLITKTIEYFNDNYNVDTILPYPDHDTITEVKINDVITTDYSKTGLTQFKIRVPLPVSGSGSLYVKYTTSGNCPEPIKTEIKRLILEQYERRGNTFEGGITSLSENSYSNLMQFLIM